MDDQEIPAMSTTPGTAGIPGLDPRVTPQYRRHALGLPAGSIRALVAVMVLAVLWLLAVYGRTDNDRIPIAFIYLQYVMILILAHYFAAHGNTIGRHVSPRSPLGLPSGSIRLLLLGGYIGLVGWLVYNQPLFEEVPEGHLVLPLVLMTCFILGFIINKLVLAVSPGGQLPFWFQDVQAWFALLAVMGLVVIALVYLVIRPSLPESMHFKMTTVETIVAGIVGFYFGARS
jgi:hypothetical protein